MKMKRSRKTNKNTGYKTYRLAGIISNLVNRKRMLNGTFHSLLRCMQFMRKYLYIFIVILISCNNENKVNIDCKEYKCYRSGKIIDTNDIQILNNYRCDIYDFTIYNLENRDSCHFNFEKADTNYLFESKSFSIAGENIEVLRISNEKTAVTDGRMYVYVLQDGKPIILVWRDWATYYKYISNKNDELIIKELEMDTSCFFNCKIRVPVPPQQL